jgi:hypothetical protein
MCQDLKLVIYIVLAISLNQFLNKIIETNQTWMPADRYSSFQDRIEEMPRDYKKKQIKTIVRVSLLLLSEKTILYFCEKKKYVLILSKLKDWSIYTYVLLYLQVAARCRVVYMYM